MSVHPPPYMVLYCPGLYCSIAAADSCPPPNPPSHPPISVIIGCCCCHRQAGCLPLHLAAGAAPDNYVAAKYCVAALLGEGAARGQRRSLIDAYDQVCYMCYMCGLACGCACVLGLGGQETAACAGCRSYGLPTWSNHVLCSASPSLTPSLPLGRLDPADACGAAGGG